ncbi:hypothetical protein T484DRAFT_1856535 [Baffinella frigidus]|nr:hypothetical protein T484DRAFT_1856535 [Cryptophyta sp. CCMP2293]
MGNVSSADTGGLGRIKTLAFELDKNLTLTSWNSECEEVFGRRAADVVGGSDIQEEAL